MSSDQSDIPEEMRIGGGSPDAPPEEHENLLAWIRADVATAREMGIADADIPRIWREMHLAQAKAEGVVPEDTQILGFEDD